MLLLLSVDLAIAQDTAVAPMPDHGVQGRINEINSWEPIEGLWEGKFVVGIAPDDYRAKYPGNMPEGTGVGVRLKMRGDQTTLSLKWDEETDWSELDGELVLFQDKIGWTVLIAREGGVWLERWYLTVTRVEERKAFFNFTRTVHNWFLSDEDRKVAEPFYSVQGIGELAKT